MPRPNGALLFAVPLPRAVPLSIGKLMQSDDRYCTYQKRFSICQRRLQQARPERQMSITVWRSCRALRAACCCWTGASQIIIPRLMFCCTCGPFQQRKWTRHSRLTYVSPLFACTAILSCRTRRRFLSAWKPGELFAMDRGRDKHVLAPLEQCIRGLAAWQQQAHSHLTNHFDALTRHVGAQLQPLHANFSKFMDGLPRPQPLAASVSRRSSQQTAGVPAPWAPLLAVSLSAVN